jgi:hypothetical protein
MDRATLTITPPLGASEDLMNKIRDAAADLSRGLVSLGCTVALEFTDGPAAAPSTASPSIGVHFENLSPPDHDADPTATSSYPRTESFLTLVEDFLNDVTEDLRTNTPTGQPLLSILDHFFRPR